MAEHTHVENNFDDWAQQPIWTYRLRRIGPGVSWYDFNSDGWEDLIVPAARGGKLAVFVNDEGKKFTLLEGAEMALSDQSAVLGWSDGKGTNKFLVGRGNMESSGEQES